ncbi:hypothetical protein VMT65_01305 [Nocardia sp. CDC153]|uniref:hypothetical protein n=1 Tax=Nocardia sp. CDC153 TaxID=3112167 RepID=UPI002DBAB369|nr:hypothetical protein [Nocardia sp. CDC153]MEC3951658.1 hypothetical protein [Nocardia sp. CDC153]
MDADFTAGPGDSRPARAPGYRLTHPDTASPGTSPNPVLTGIDTGGHGGLGRNGQDAQAVQWSSAPVTLRGAPDSDGLPRRLAPDLPQRTAEPEAVAARLAAEGEPLGADAFAARATTNGSLYNRTSYDTGSLTRPEPNGESFTAAPAVGVEGLAMGTEGLGVRPAANGSPFAASPAAEIEGLDARPATNGSPFADRSDARSEVFGASPAVEIETPVARRYAPDPEPPARFEAPARLESLEAVAASLRETAEESPRASTPPAKAPSRRRAAPEPVVEPPVSAKPETKAAAEFRTSDATIDLHHIMRLLTASHDLDEAAKAAEAGEISVADLAKVAQRTRAAAVELVAAWYGGADHMRKFGEVLLQAAAETA